MTLRFTNTAILILIAVLTLTGVYGLFYTLNGWTFDVHRWAGWALMALIPWKTAISLRSLRRGLRSDFDRGVMIFASVLLAVLTLAAGGLALTWALRIGPKVAWLGQTAVSWHWLLALGLLLPFALHVWRRWPRPRRSDFLSRRAALKALTAGAAGLVGWRVAEAVADWRSRPEAPRRFTGSREAGSFSGNRFPVTNNPGEGEARMDPATWALILTGAVAKSLSFSYEELLSAPPSGKIATVDCTLGWYSTQAWRGVPLKRLLEQAGLPAGAHSIKLKSVSGYAHVFPIAEAGDILLATHVGGEVLDHWHGFPLRAVVPSRRGWFWVKWLTEIEVMAEPPQ